VRRAAAALCRAALSLQYGRNRENPTGKVKKRALRDRGLAPGVWDREMAGYKLERDEGRTTRSPGRFAATSEQNRG